METVNVTPGSAANATESVGSDNSSQNQNNSQGAPQRDSGNRNQPQQRESRVQPPPQENKSQELYEVKINGATRKFTLEQLKSQAILGAGSYERFEQASQKEKKYSQWKEQAKTDTLKALMDPELGLSKDEIRHKFESWYKENFIDPETMSAEEKRIAQAEREAREWREKATSYEEKEKQKKEEHEQNQLRDSVQKEIIQFLEESELPKTRFFANRAIYWKRLAISKGFDAPNEVIKQQVSNEFSDVIKTFAQECSEKQLVELMGEEVIKKLRKYDLGQLKNRFNQGNSEPTIGNDRGAANKREGGKLPMSSVDDYFNSLRKERR